MEGSEVSQVLQNENRARMSRRWRSETPLLLFISQLHEDIKNCRRVIDRRRHRINVVNIIVQTPPVHELHPMMLGGDLGALILIATIISVGVSHVLQELIR